MARAIAAAALRLVVASSHPPILSRFALAAPSTACPLLLAPRILFPADPSRNYARRSFVSEEDDEVEYEGTKNGYIGGQEDDIFESEDEPPLVDDDEVEYDDEFDFESESDDDDE